MNELLFYGGIGLAGVSLLAAVVLFFYNKVYLSISFFLHRNHKVAAKKPAVAPVKKKKEEKRVQENTPKVSKDSTELLEMTEDYTEILCDDVTEILESCYE